jgi:hypothetical protein
MGRLVRLAAKRDANEAELVKWLREHGWYVAHCSSTALPDLICFRLGVLMLVEVKMPGKKHTGAQLIFHTNAYIQGVNDQIITASSISDLIDRGME